LQRATGEGAGNADSSGRLDAQPADAAHDLDDVAVCVLRGGVPSTWARYSSDIAVSLSMVVLAVIAPALITTARHCRFGDVDLEAVGDAQRCRCSGRRDLSRCSHRSPSPGSGAGERRSLV
jgi:hypothetical protein